MPRVVRRTPETEEAASYNYGDFLKDILRKVVESDPLEKQRLLNKKPTEEDLLEIAMAPAGGMLKVAGTGKLLGGLLKRRKAFEKALDYAGDPRDLDSLIQARFERPAQTFREALKVPEKEYRRIRDINWSSMKGEARGTKGLYFPREKDIALHPTLADTETIWHEFTHARQWNPEKMSKMPGGGTEEAASQELQRLLKELRELAYQARISKTDFYYQVSPIERHARGVASSALKYPTDFDLIYKTGLKRELFSGEKLRKLWKEPKRFLLKN